jgi:hypothetical protein
MVLMSVDFPRPVWPIMHQYTASNKSADRLTNADDIELETALQKLLLNLLCDAVESDMTSGEDGIPLRHCCGHDGFF